MPLKSNDFVVQSNESKVEAPPHPSSKGRESGAEVSPPLGELEGTVKIMFETHLPLIHQTAITSPDAETFKCRLTDILHLNDSDSLSAGQENIKRLIDNDGITVIEASSEQEMKIETISCLWRFLTEKENANRCNPDFLIDIYKQFEALDTKLPPLPEKNDVMRWMDRWPSGNHPAIKKIREENKQRIITYLVECIEKRHSEKTKYKFPPGISLTEKHEMVETWWSDYRFHTTMAARSLRELNRMMGNTLSESTKTIYREAHKKGIPVFVTPYYLSLMDISGEGFDDSTLRSYVFYSQNLVDTFGNIKAWEREDIVEPGKPNAAGWILPEGNNIHRRYPEVAILIPDTIGRACGGLCASCQRMYDFQSGRFNFNLEKLKPKETWGNKLLKIMEFFRNDKEIRDILITGGDALMSRNNSLRKILDAIYTMAKQKREDNKNRPDGEQYAEIQRIRLGTRLPVYLPMRIDDELASILEAFKTKAQQIGISQFIIQTHFQTPLEITPEVCAAIRKLQSAGWTVTNQLVFNVAASRRGHTARLRKELNKIGILCYYTFTVKGFAENHAVFAPNSRSLQEQKEEKVIGQMNDDQSRELLDALYDSNDYENIIREFQTKHQLPFLATDRNVLNLPGIGKSMTFNLVGIMPDGCRMLAFDHDHTRKHSPVIQDMPVVYIKENKSIWKYLRQLKEWGEDISCYETIWHYNDGQTEPQFALYEYPS